MRKAATTAAAVVLAATGLATGGISPATAAPGDLPGGTDSTCFWYYGAFGGSPKTFNMAYPDAGARYWGAIFRRPPGSTLKIHGLYPHARYTSLISYDALGQIVDGLADYQIDPDPGSTNPFRPGARRDGRSRSYTVTILDQQNLDPATGRTLFNKTNPRTNERHRNALYARGDTPTFENVGGTTYEFQGFAVRVYIPDRGRDLRGGKRRAGRGYVADERWIEPQQLLGAPSLGSGRVGPAVHDPVINGGESCRVGIAEVRDLHRCRALGEDRETFTSGQPCQVDQHVDPVVTYGRGDLR